MSLGFSRLSPEFWDNSLLVKPKDPERNVVCHASAWNLFKGSDFRIKMCTGVDMDNLLTIHHEMGHIYYYMQYSNLPIIFQGAANPGQLF